jgi:hypothetical protein
MIAVKSNPKMITWSPESLMGRVMRLLDRTEIDSGLSWSQVREFMNKSKFP